MTEDNERTITNTEGEVVAHTAGAFDIRTFIAALMGVFGVILVVAGVAGLDDTSGTTQASGSVNTWVGLAVLVFAALMQTWAKLRPTVIEEQPQQD